MFRRLAISSVLAAALFAPPAHADDRATAQELFQNAKELMLAGKTVEACAKFAAAADLVQTVGVRLNLAACFEKIGRTASAWTRYDEALTIAERNGDTAAAQLARSSQDALRPHLSYLSVTVSKDAAAVVQLGILRDGQNVPPAAWGVPVPVDPGEHEIKAIAPGRKSWLTTTTVSGEGTHADVQVPVLAVEAGPPVEIAPSPHPGAATTTTEPAHGKLGTQKVVALATGGAGVVALIVGGAFGLLAVSAWNDQRTACATSQSCTVSGHAAATADHSTMNTDATVSTAAFIAGGVLIVGGVGLFLSNGRVEHAAPPPATSLMFAPSFGVGSAGLSLTGKF